MVVALIQVYTSFSFFFPPSPPPLFLLLNFFIFIFIVICDIQLAICLRDRYTVTILKPQTHERCDLVASLCAKFQAHGDRGWPEILTLRFELKWIHLLTLHAIDKTIHPFIVCELLHCMHDQHSWMCTTGSKGWEMNRVVELERDGNLIWNGEKTSTALLSYSWRHFPFAMLHMAGYEMKVTIDVGFVLHVERLQLKWQPQAGYCFSGKEMGCDVLLRFLLVTFMYADCLFCPSFLFPSGDNIVSV